jgi:hypothetical protein
MEPGRPVTGIVQILKKSKLDMAQIKDAALAHALKRWMRPDAHRFVRPDWRRFVRPGFEKDHPFALYERKYRLDQLRDELGRWAYEGGRRLIRAVAPWPSNGPPEIPEDRPSTSKERTRFAKIAAAFVRGNAARLLILATTAHWLLGEAASILSYSDPPKTLKELQDAVSLISRPGYQDHHIVEQTPARKEGFPNSRIDDSENVVRIPARKHRDISDWYSTSNEDFGGQSPRDYLRGRSWEERR